MAKKLIKPMQYPESGETKQNIVKQNIWPIILLAITGGDQKEIRKKKVEEFKKEMYEYYRRQYSSSDNHCDTRSAGNFTVSPNGKVVAYTVTRMYETYHIGRDEDWNSLLLKNLETDKTKTVMSLDKYMDSKSDYYDKDICIDEILEVSNGMKVKYKTQSGKTITA